MRYFLGLLLVSVLAGQAFAQNPYAGSFGGSSSLVIGTTPITGGATTQVLFNLAGVVTSDTGFTYAGGGGQVKLNGGSAAVPALALSPGNNTGIYSTGNFVQIGILGTNVAAFTGTAFQEASNNTIGWTNGAAWKALAIGSIQQGGADAATATAQTYRTQGVVAGTMNVAGADFTVAVSPGTGTGAGGSFIVQTAPAHGSDTVQGTLTSVFSINSAGNVAATLATAAGTNIVCNTPGTMTALTVEPLATTCSGSSARFKDGIAAIDRQRAFETVLSLRPVSYFYRRDYLDDPDKHIGFIAEQADRLPSPVDGYSLTTTEKDSDLLHGFKYNEMTPLLVAAIQQLKADNDNLRTEIEILKKRSQQ